jgi:hypothetical protein
VLDADTRPLITWFLHRGRRLRAAGVAAGLVVTGAPLYVDLIDPARSPDFAGPLSGMAWIIEAALGAAVAEISFVQRSLRAGAAVLQRRRWDHYVSRRLVLYVGGVITLALAGAMLGLLAEVGQRTEVLAAAGAALAAGALLVIGLWHIVRRPRLALEERWRVVDDALRADGANRLVGASAAMASAAASVAVWQSLREVAPAAGFLVSFVLCTVGLGLWWALSRDVVWRTKAEHVVA